MGKSTFLQDFKAFAMKGNVIDMAVGVIIGGAFGKIVSSVVADVIMPPLGLLVGGVNFTDLKWVMKPAEVVDGKEITDKKADINKLRQHIGMVFQHFNLFPNMTVLKNITLAPVRLGKWNVAEADQKARALLA